MKARIVALAALILGIVVSVNAQQGRASRDILQRAGASVGGRDVVTAMHVYHGGVSEAQHIHPGDLVGYVVEGMVTLAQDGKAPVTLTAGQTFYENPTDVHRVSANASTTAPAKILVFMVKDKDKPATTPAK